MLVLASMFNDAATSVGLMAGSIAVGGFLAHARPAMDGSDERTVRSMTVRGGLAGFGISVLVGLVGLLVR